MLMPWNIIGHDRQIERFRRATQNRRLASTFLFVGPAGIGKRTFAQQLAAALLCEATTTVALDPCGSCASCLQVAAGSHPDLHLVAKPPDKSMLPLELLIGDREHRMKAGLCYQMSLKPRAGKRKIAIIDDADYLNAEGANCLLKLLEEPPDQVVIFLLAEDYLSLLPTIVSRCQLIKLRPVLSSVISKVLQDVYGASFELARTLSGLSNGRPGWAISAFADQEILDETTKALHSTETLLDLSIEERLKYASEITSRMSTEKKIARKNLMLWTTWWRAVLFDKQDVLGTEKSGLTFESSHSAASTLSVLQICNAIKSIQKASYYLERNVNPRLIFEQLMLELPNRR